VKKIRISPDRSPRRTLQRLAGFSLRHFALLRLNFLWYNGGSERNSFCNSLPELTVVISPAVLVFCPAPLFYSVSY
jgi:hypothetical protein